VLLAPFTSTRPTDFTRKRVAAQGSRGFRRPGNQGLHGGDHPLKPGVMAHMMRATAVASACPRMGTQRQCDPVVVS